MGSEASKARLDITQVDEAAGTYAAGARACTPEAATGAPGTEARGSTNATSFGDGGKPARREKRPRRKNHNSAKNTAPEGEGAYISN